MKKWPLFLILLFYFTSNNFAQEIKIAKLTEHACLNSPIWIGINKIAFIKKLGENEDIYIYYFDKKVSTCIKNGLNNKIYQIAYNSADENIFYLENNKIFSINCDGNKQSEIYVSSTYIRDIQISPNGKQIAFCEGYNNIFLMNVNGTNVNKLVDGKHSEHEISYCWLKDSSGIIYCQNSNILKINSQLQNSVKLADGYCPTVSRDNVVAYIPSNDRNKLWTMDIEGKNKKRILQNIINYHSPIKFTNDGKYIIFLDSYSFVYLLDIKTKNTKCTELKFNAQYFQIDSFLNNENILYSDTKDIWMLNISNFQKSNLTNNEMPIRNLLPSSESHLSNSHFNNGRKIIYYCWNDISKGKELWLMDCNGKNKKFITRLSDEVFSCALMSPDGKKLSFVKKSEDNKYREIWFSDIDLGFCTKLASTTNYYFTNMSWSPDSKKLAYNYSWTPNDEYLYIADYDTKLTRNITEKGEMDFIKNWCSNNKIVCYGTFKESGYSKNEGQWSKKWDCLYIYNLQENKKTMLSNGQHAKMLKNNLLAYDTYDGEIWTINIESGEKAKIVEKRGGSYEFWCPPDGSKIAYRHAGKVFCIDVITKKASNLSNSFFDKLIWSWDSSRIAFYPFEPIPGLFLIQPDGIGAQFISKDFRIPSESGFEFSQVENKLFFGSYSDIYSVEY